MANTMTKPRAIKPSAFEAEIKQVGDGIQKNFPATESVMVNGKPKQQPALLTTLQNWITIFEAVGGAKQQYHAAVNARVAITVQAREEIKAIKAALKQYFGNQSPLLPSFGIPMDRPRNTTAKAQVMTQAKCEQTRKVRGTLGKKQKAAVKVVGDPPVGITSAGELQIGTPPVNVAGSPATPAPTPAPAGSGSGGSSPAGNTPA